MVAVVTEEQATATTVKLGFTYTRSGTDGGTFDWELVSESDIYFASIRILASGSGAVPPGAISGFFVEQTAIAFEHRDLPIGSRVVFRIRNLTGAVRFSAGRLIVEQRLLVP